MITLAARNASVWVASLKSYGDIRCPGSDHQRFASLRPGGLHGLRKIRCAAY